MDPSDDYDNRPKENETPTREGPSPGDLLTRNQELETTILGHLDYLVAASTSTDKRWIAIARTHIEQGFMAAHRAIQGGHYGS